MKPNYTHIALVLDRSYSMEAIRKATIEGLNGFIGANRHAQGDCSITATQFDSESMDTIHQFRPVKDVQDWTEATYIPRGSTPLWDAIGRVIVSTGDDLHRLPESLRPAKVIFVIITDGYENASHEYTAARVQQMIKHQRESYKWEFVFIGANIDSYAVGHQAGILRTHTMNYAANDAGTLAAFMSMADNSVKYRASLKADMSWEDADRAKQRAAGANE